MVYEDIVQQYYVGFYGRPADPDGLEYWSGQLGEAGGDETAILGYFANSQEYEDFVLLDELGQPRDNEELVNFIYNNLFGRDAETAGLNFWVGKLDAGEISLMEIVAQVIDGAQGTDKDAFANKVAVAKYFTDNLDNLPYNGADIADVREILAGVDADPASVDSGEDAVDDWMYETLGLSLTADKADVDEGGVVLFTLTSENGTPGDSYSYTISGVDQADVVGGQLTGTVTLDADGEAVIQIGLTEDAKTEGAENLTVTLAKETATVVVNDTSLDPPILPQTFILTAGQDTFTGDIEDDTFLATQATLQNGDILDGADGDDTLTLSVGGSSDFFAAPTLSNIETIIVNSPNNDDQAIELDLSNADGYTTLESFQVTSYYGPQNAFVGFWDIQNVNGTDIRIIDTNVDHEFTYDTNAYVTRTGGNYDDVVDLYLSEVDGSAIMFGNDVPYTPGESDVDQINITSAQRNQINDTTFNYLSGLYVGADLYTVMIGGDADLEIDDFLDSNVNLVDARGLNADLTLSLWGQGDSVHANDILTLYGAQQDDDIFILGDGHNMVDLGTGDDFLYAIGDGEHNIVLGEGDDELWLEGDVDGNLDVQGLEWWGITTIDAGSGNDYVGVWGDDYGYYQGIGDYLITLGAGNDELEMWVDGNQTIDAGAGNDAVSIWGDGDSQIQAGDGNDTVYIDGDGNQVIGGGQGADSITIWGDGDQTIDAGTEDDWVAINGDGVHWIDLGAGDDYLYISGDRNATGNIDYAGIYDEMTTIVGGEGNDTVVLDGDHYLNADLGTGDDWLMMHAEHLTADDLIAAGEGIDRLSLLNQTGQAVYVGASETSSTTGVEIFDLWNSDITLKLTSDNFDTAEGNDIAVWTTNSSTFELPTWLSFNGVTLSQGMSRTDYNLFKAGFEAWWGGSLEDYLVTYYVEAVDFTDGDQSGDENVYDFVGDTYVLSNIPANDTVFFRAEPGVQTIDITNVPLTVASGRSFTLDGGNIRDIVIADDLAINGRLTLDYDADNGTPDSILDTLVVVDAATITSADLRNVDGLEIIELKATQNAAQVWNIELSDNIINQTTGSADLIIRVDPNVAAGSVLNIQLDPSVFWADNDVIVETVGNISVYIDKGDGMGLQLVTEPDLGVTDYNDGYYDLIVIPRLLFTSNPDSLIGTDLDDLFLATSVTQLDGADFADGNLGYDTLQLDFAVANPALSLWMQLENAQLVEIEHILFNTGNNVRMNGIGFGQYLDLQEITTGSGNDQLYAMREGLTYNLQGGDDLLEVESIIGFGPQTTVYGGLGDDTVNGGIWSDNILAYDVQLINAGGSLDTITIGQVVDSGNVTVNGGDADDTVNVLGKINGVIYTNDVEVVNDSGEANHIVANGYDVAVYGASGNDTIYVDTENDAMVYGGYGDDNITVYADADATVYGNDGADWIWVSADNALVYGDSSAGPDTIYVYAEDNATVHGGAYDDLMYVSVGHHALVYGDEGNDVIDVWTEDDATVEGGSGNDDIQLNYGDYYDDWAVHEGEIFGGDGNDSIAVVNYWNNAEVYTSITGGAGDDSIDLTYSLDGVDTLFFGTIDYNALQAVELDSQGLDTIDDFVFESQDLTGDPAPEPEDVMDFTAFLGDSIANLVTIPGTWNQGDTVVANANAGNAIVVLSSNGDPALTPFDFSVSLANTIQLNDQGSAVVVVGTDQTGSGSGIMTFNIYYVQDIDTTVGAQTWAVDQVAVVESATRVGVEAVMDNLVGGLDIEIIGTDGDDVLVGTDLEDFIDPGAGLDVITTGGGDDVIRYYQHTDADGDTITDFDVEGDDVLEFWIDPTNAFGSAYSVGLNIITGSSAGAANLQNAGYGSTLNGIFGTFASTAAFTAALVGLTGVNVSQTYVAFAVNTAGTQLWAAYAYEWTMGLTDIDSASVIMTLGVENVDANDIMFV